RVPVLAQRRAVLVEVGHLQVAALADLAGGRRQFAQQQLEQRGLAAAVGTDQADAVAAQDGGGEIPDDGPIRSGIGERDIARLDHLLAGRGTLRDFHAHVAGQLAALAALAAHRFQAPHATLVARPARLDALPDPRLLLRQQLVEARALLLLRIQPLLAAALVVGPVARPAAHLAAV